MNKFICISFLAVFMVACSYNPVQFEQQRQYDNAMHNRMMG